MERKEIENAKVFNILCGIDRVEAEAMSEEQIRRKVFLLHSQVAQGDEKASGASIENRTFLLLILG